MTIPRKPQQIPQVEQQHSITSPLSATEEQQQEPPPETTPTSSLPPHGDRTLTPKKKTTFNEDNRVATIPHDQQQQVDDDKSDSTTTTTPYSTTTTTRSSGHPIRLKIHMCGCHKMLRLNVMKILSLIAMTSNILAFVAIAVVMINAHIIQSDIEMDILLLRGDLSSLSEKTKCAVQLTAYGNKTTFMDGYNNYVVNVTNSLKILKSELLPSNLYILNDTNEPTMDMDRAFMDFVNNGKASQAVALLESEEYSKKRQLFNTFMNNVLQYSSEVAESKNSYILTAGIINLTLIMTALVVVVPVVLIVFIMALRKERISSKKLKKATGIMLMDTMEDEKEKLKFKEFCQKEGGMEIFLFMDKTLDFVKLCKKQEEILKKHPELISQLDREEKHNSSIENSKKKYKASNATKQELPNKHNTSSEQQLWKEIEKEKYELVFEIISEYLDGDVGECPLVVSGHIHDSLIKQVDAFDIDKVQTYFKSSLFDAIQKEISNAYLNILHFRFKHLKEERKMDHNVEVKIQA
nr:unnamed protein product [Naegleria fowleri]